MACSKLQISELSSMDPENYKKFFRAIQWVPNRKLDKKSHKKISKRERLRRIKAAGLVGVCIAPVLLRNASHFAVYATVRKSILTGSGQLRSVNTETPDNSDDEEPSCSHHHHPRVPKITGIGLCAVFSLISEARFSNERFCEKSLEALFDILQAHSPEAMAEEPQEMISTLHSMLTEVTTDIGPTGRVDVPTNYTAQSSSCLIALSVAKGEAELILNAIATLIMVPKAMAEQYIRVPFNLTTLQRSVQSVILGESSRNQWIDFGVPHQSLVSSFSVDLPCMMSGSGELIVRSMASDGCYLYLYTAKGLFKIGSGYGSSIRQHVYQSKSDFFKGDHHGWLGYCQNKLYVRIGRKKCDVYEVNKETLEVIRVLRLDPGIPGTPEPKSAVFTDGYQLGLILLNTYDNLTVKMYEVNENSEHNELLASRKDLNVHLLRQRTIALGRPPFDDGMSRRPGDFDRPVLMQFDDNVRDPLRSICVGQDFGLLTTASGKVYYTGKGTSLGYKMASPHIGRWTLMKETLFNKHVPNLQKSKVVQTAVGHEGCHAILVLDNGNVLFTGIARRGEDGDSEKSRRNPKPSRPTKMTKVISQYIVYAACNYGSTALLTRQGLLFIFGKDTQHCDKSGLVTGLRHERIIQVALGKAHVVALTNLGQVYTFGINNKSQCGREFGYGKEKYHPRRTRKEMVQMCPGEHTFVADYCRVCTLCRRCTGLDNDCCCGPTSSCVPAEYCRACNCKESESSCSTCGVCRKCASVAKTPHTSKSDANEDIEIDPPEQTSESEEMSNVMEYEMASAGPSSEVEEDRGERSDKDAAMKVNSLPPARIAVPGGHRVVAIACGLHHTVLLSQNGEVLTFGSNQMGQLGAGDVAPHHRIIRLRSLRAFAVAAGSNHTAVMSRDGELYTFGSHQKGALGRQQPEEHPRQERGVWYATPGRVSRIGTRGASKALWVTACGDQTFVHLTQSVFNTDSLFSSTITANGNNIVILPNRPEHTFKCITINKLDGSCNAWTGSEQFEFVNSVACLDPLYDVLWSYKPATKAMKCFNILAFDANKLLRCYNDPNATTENENQYPNYGIMKRLEDFKDLTTFDGCRTNDEKPKEILTRTNLSVLNHDLAIPNVADCQVTRMHAALHLLGCLDTLTYAHDNKLTITEYKPDSMSMGAAPLLEDFLVVNRFAGHGGGWAYSAHSVEAVRFMCDTEILLGGYGLFGGRGDYTASIKLFDIGRQGGDEEGNGNLLAESDEVVYECAPRGRFPVLFDSPVSIYANRWYVAWASVNGFSSDCGSLGQSMVINDEIGFHFKSSKMSNNGTDVNTGQIPCLLYNVLGSDALPLRQKQRHEPVVVLSKNISSKVTVGCFKSLMMVMEWSWKAFKDMIESTNGLVPINYQKLSAMKQQKRLVYVISSCMRLIRSYINEIFPSTCKKRNSYECSSYSEAIGDIRNFLQSIMSQQVPICAPMLRQSGRRGYRACYVEFSLELTQSLLKEAHDTVTSCFHAFYPTPTLKWNHLCSRLIYVKKGKVPMASVLELTSTCAALCSSYNLLDLLQYIVGVTQSFLHADKKRRAERSEAKMAKDSLSDPGPSSSSSHSTNPPPVAPVSNHTSQEESQPQPAYVDWHLMNAMPRLLDMVLLPVKRRMSTRQCPKFHDHGEAAAHQRLAEYCCKFLVRIVAELAQYTNDARDELDSNTVKHLVTPSRFVRVNQNPTWNTGNGSPDSIAFIVDRPGVMLVGACVYGGGGSFDYSLELMQDQLRVTSEEPRPAHCWLCVDSVHGTFTAADCHHDMATIKFERAFALREDFQYALKFCNRGGRTLNGDCGLTSVTGPDGTTFHFSSSSLSYNGTTLARGQIPCLVYYSSSMLLTNASETNDAIVSALRTMTVRVGALVMERSTEFLASLGEISPGRNLALLRDSPAINTLLPYVLTHLETIDDPKSYVRVLELIHKMLPHVTALNLKTPSKEPASPPGQHYTWVESPHPYQQSTVTNMRVLYPKSVSWISLEMDPHSITAQPEDTLTIYAAAGAPVTRCSAAKEPLISESPFRKLYKRRILLSAEEGEQDDFNDEGDLETDCTHHNKVYLSVTPQLANVASEYPENAIVIPGNEVIFSLETASDYLSGYKIDNGPDSRFGFRCLCVGYDDAPFTTQRNGLALLEMELVYAGAACASRLLAPDLDLPYTSLKTLADIQYLTTWGLPREGEPPLDNTEMNFIARGLDLATLPTIHQVLDGQKLSRNASAEKQFLLDFVAGAENTAGGRLARWLAPLPHVDPTKCEMKIMSSGTKPTYPITVSVIIRDQYGEPVISPSLKVEVLVLRLRNNVGGKRRYHMDGEEEESVPNVPYQTTVQDNAGYHSITMMQPYQNYSFEELRLASGMWWEENNPADGNDEETMMTEPMMINAQSDGTYLATWVPQEPGDYVGTCLLDHVPTNLEAMFKVNLSGEPSEDNPFESGNEGLDVAVEEVQSRLRRFGIDNSAGLRVRSSPSLQSEEVGCIPPDSDVGFVEEVENKDGVWVRLSEQSIQAYTKCPVGIAWSLQYHRQLDLVLLVSNQTSEADEQEVIVCWSDDQQSQHSACKPEEEQSINDASDEEDRRFPFSIDLGNDALAAKKYDASQSHRLLIGPGYTFSRSPVTRLRNSVASSSDEGSSLFVYGAEPSKRCRLARRGGVAASAAPAGSPRRFQRKSNGNREEMMAARRQDDNVQDDNIEEMDIEPEPHSQSQLAQAGTQTSSDTYADGALAQMVHGSYNVDVEIEDLSEDRQRSRSGSRDRSKARALRSSPPPMLAQASSSASPPPPLPPHKHAICPTQAKCLRSIFAALLWHGGAVHDAIACAAFLKFNHRLPRAGESVVTRRAAHRSATPRPQRHSVEVASSGQYLDLNPSTLETLTRSGNEACASRERNTDMDETITEEGAGTSEAGGSSSSVVNVMPPALRALVTLWDALYDSDQLAIVTDKYKKGAAENKDNEVTRLSSIRKKKDRKISAKAPYSVHCELCGGTKVPPPLGAHMRHRHPGCREIATAGYDRAGVYRRAESPPQITRHFQPICGHLTQGNQLWYVFCEQCREKCLRAAAAQKQDKSKVVSEPIIRVEPEVDFINMHNNAVFLLDVVPIAEKGSSRSPPTPAGSMWQPAPAFQCLAALGAAPRTSARDAKRYHSLGRPQPPPLSPSPIKSKEMPSTSSGAGGWRRMYRSVSMGPAGGPLARQCSLFARTVNSQGQESLADVQYLASSSASLLGQPTANLRRLIGYGVNDDAFSAFEIPNVDSAKLFRSPVLLFVLARRDIKTHEMKMEAAARVNAVRQYACEALNWLLRSATQLTCVHDVMWWFSETLSQYESSPPPSPVVQENQEQDGKQDQSPEQANQERVYRESNATGASTCALCPGGRSVRGARAAVHALLGSVSALAPSLHPASAPGLQAVRCWALQYSQHDRSFLHRSQVFSVISRILSHGEDGAFDEAAVGALHESYHTYQNNENIVWNCPDVTSWCEITVSSRQNMAAALNDGSTETFWESAEDERNKSKWIQVTCPSGTAEDRPYLVCLHVDNSRDTSNKTLFASFLFSSGSDELAYMQEVDIDSENASWICYALPQLPCAPTRVRCELRGSNPNVRVRQVRVLGLPRAQLPGPGPAPAHGPAQALQTLVEQDTLRVFRLLTTEVFGKLLEYDAIGAEGNDAAAPAEIVIANESDLREHVVGILFAGHKMTKLQNQVMTHIVCAIRCEATRAREDWESALLAAESELAAPPRPPVQDNYCFEMLSLLLALSGSSMGRANLAQRLELMSDIVTLLHAGSDRVQRQIISLLRRMMTEIQPQKVSVALNFGLEESHKTSMLDCLVSYLAKAITIQVKVKGSVTPVPGSMTMGGSVKPAPPAAWYMRGQTTKEHAQLVAKLLLDMAEDRLSPAWGEETRRALATYALQMAQASDVDRRPDRCIVLPYMWMALASLCVCEQSYIELFKSSDGEDVRAAAEARSFCVNHDDGNTMAVINCSSCGPLCAECDRFLHLNRVARSHSRQISKEEKNAIRIDIHEGCARAKLFWILMLVDRSTLKGLVEFRGLNQVTDPANVLAGEGTSTGTQGSAGICRFCGTRSTSGLLAIGNICAEEQCQDLAKEACSRELSCGHVCGGVRGETNCLPCLLGCAPPQDAAPLRQDADDMCMICFTDPLHGAPAIQLKCGHVFHLHCCKKVLTSKWIGPRITFAFSKCPICKEDMSHCTLEELLAQIRVLYEDVRRKALMRLQYDGLAETQARSSTDPVTYAMERYAYYVCHKCNKAYFGGLARCEAESNVHWEPTELMCGACSDTTGARVCPKHGSDFLEYKCRYCCSVAVFFCFGTSHFCNACHDDFQRITNIPRHLLPQCPAGPRGEQMPGTADDCPLHVQHPSTGEEFALGCGICRQSLPF